MSNIFNNYVLITGASSGIGAATAELFAKHGANLLLVARRIDKLQSLKENIQSKYNVIIDSLELDVRDEQAVRNKLSVYQNIDLLVNNAGLALGLDDISNGNQDHWNTMIDTNIKGFLSISKVVAQQMISNKAGHIINIGSIAGIESYAKGGVYCATKHAVHAITKSLREELTQYDIRVSEVLPGAVETEFSAVRFNGDQERAKNVYKGFTPLTAVDIAELIVYIANAPKHVNLAECLILPTRQASASKIYRDN